jgi:hypothetical protein
MYAHLLSNLHAGAIDLGHVGETISLETVPAESRELAYYGDYMSMGFFFPHLKEQIFASFHENVAETIRFFDVVHVETGIVCAPVRREGICFDHVGAIVDEGSVYCLDLSKKHS